MDAKSSKIQALDKALTQAEDHARRMRRLLDTVTGAIEHEPASLFSDGRPGPRSGPSYPFIPLSTLHFVDLLATANKYFAENSLSLRHKTFVDVGCGPGTKLVLATADGFRATGIENDDKMIRRAKKLFSIPLQGSDGPLCWKRGGGKYIPRIIRGDILKQDYSVYDVIYFYCPFKCIKQQRRLDERIQDQMKIGAVLIPIMHGGGIDKKRLKTIGSSVYVKHKA